MTPDVPTADLIVIGLGAMGASVSLHAARRGMSVLGIDQFSPPHKLGSTHAETRVSRLAVGEGAEYLPFVARSHELWREFEALTGETLLHQCGGLIVTEPRRAGTRWRDFVSVTDDIAKAAGINFELRTPASIRAEHPMLRIPDANSVGFERTAGLVLNERAVAVQLALAGAAGADLHTGEKVIDIDPKKDRVRVTTDRGVYEAEQVVLAAGAWIPSLASADRAAALTVTRQVVFWFEAEDLERFSTEHLPFVMWIGEVDENYFAVFPVAPGTTPAVKVLGEQFLTSTTAETVHRTVSDSEKHEFFEKHLASKIDGIRPDCLRAEVCLYTNTVDDDFLIDRDARSDRILVMSPCSGHGFKHSAGLGEAVAELMSAGRSTLDLSPFAAR